jgi:hypothetical protein
MKEKEIKKHIEEGFLRARVIFEIIGKPKEHIENTLKAYIENIKTKETDIHILEEEYEPAEEIEEELFSVIAEVELLVPNIEKLTWLAINFSPASIELIQPDAITLEQKQVSHWITDMLARLHEVGVIQKTLTGQNQALIKNFNAMTRNAILLCLQDGGKDVEFICKKIGMPAEHTDKFLEALQQEKKIKKEKNQYYLAE